MKSLRIVFNVLKKKARLKMRDVMNVHKVFKMPKINNASGLDYVHCKGKLNDIKVKKRRVE